MKSFCRFICACLFAGSAAVSMAQPKTVTFDDFIIGSGSGEIDDGYEGLQWNVFRILNGMQSSGGYKNGTVSSSNVVFNAAGYPASILRNVPFDFHSAYLTAASVNNLQVRVQGYAGTNLTYETTHSLLTGAPTLIQLNYIGVNRVTFTPLQSSQFAMDNMSVTLPTSAPTNSHQIEFATVGHSFPQPHWISDYLISQGDEGTNNVVPHWTIDFDTTNQFVLTIAAPLGKKFFVHVPTGKEVYLGGSLIWQANSSNGPSRRGTVVASFGELEGPAPDCSESVCTLSDYHGNFGFDEIRSKAITNDIAFSSITLTATVPSQYVGTGTLEYDAGSGGFLGFYYKTSKTNDPGPFVSLVSSDQNTNSFSGVTIQVSKIEHTFSASYLLPENAPPYPSTDYLVEQSQGYGGGGMLKSFWADFSANGQFALTISAPVGKKWLIDLPPGQTARFLGSLDWNICFPGFGNYSLTQPQAFSVVFGGLEGSAPGFSESNARLSTYNGAFSLYIESASFSNDVAFTSMTFSTTMASSYTNSEPFFYVSDDSYLLLRSFVPGDEDPGPFISLVPANQPTMSFIVTANGDITIIFTGTLQSAENVAGPFENVPGNPQGTYTIPRASQTGQRFFRATNN